VQHCALETRNFGKGIAVQMNEENILGRNVDNYQLLPSVELCSILYIAMHIEIICKLICLSFPMGNERLHLVAIE
jgi:hypothetical protein